MFANFNAGIHVADVDHMHFRNPISAFEFHLYMIMLSVGVFWQFEFLHKFIGLYVLPFFGLPFVIFGNICFSFNFNMFILLIIVILNFTFSFFIYPLS